MKKIIVLLVLLFAESAWAGNTYYVDITNGQDSRSCSAAQTITTPKQHIMNAMTCLVAGNADIIDVRAGTYSEAISNQSVTIPSGTSYLNAATLQAHAGETVVLTSQTNFNYTKLRYFIVKGWSQTGTDTKGWVYDASGYTSSTTTAITIGRNNDHIKFDSIEIKNANGFASASGGGNAIWVTNSYIHDCSNPTHTLGNLTCHGIYTTNYGTDGLWENNVIRNVDGYGFVEFVDYGHGNTGPSNNNNIVRNNFFDNTATGTAPAAYGIGVSTGQTSTGHQIYNNIVSGGSSGTGLNGIGARNAVIYSNTIYNVGFGQPSSGSCCYPAIKAANSTLRNNIVYHNNTNSIVNTGGNSSNNFTTDPKFVDPTNKDFRLCIAAGNPTANCTTASTAIDSGADLSIDGSQYAQDKNGTSRALGKSWDPGALEAKK